MLGSVLLQLPIGTVFAYESFIKQVNILSSFSSQSASLTGEGWQLSIFVFISGEA